MRAPLVVTAATAALLAAAAVPAEAAAAYCAVRLAATAVGESASCTVAHPGVNGLIRRQLDFHVAAGLVTATVSCGPNVRSLTVAAPFTGSIVVTQPRDTSCGNTLRADSAVAVAHGVSTYTVVYV